jgi:hypothetical protein
MTSNVRPEVEQLIASAGCGGDNIQPTSGAGGCEPSRRLKLTVGNGSNNTATNLDKAMNAAQCMRNFAQCMRNRAGKDFPDPLTDGSLIDSSQIRSAAVSGAHNTPGFRAGADRCTAVYSSAVGVQGK